MRVKYNLTDGEKKVKTEQKQGAELANTLLLSLLPTCFQERQWVSPLPMSWISQQENKTRKRSMTPRTSTDNSVVGLQYVNYTFDYAEPHFPNFSVKMNHKEEFFYSP